MKITELELFGMKVAPSEGVSPDEIILLTSTNAVRYTPDGGIESLSPYQVKRIKESINYETPRLGEGIMESLNTIDSILAEDLPEDETPEPPRE